MRSADLSAENVDAIRVASDTVGFQQFERVENESRRMAGEVS